MKLFENFADMLTYMYSISVWDNEGRQYLPVFDYEWKQVTNYAPAREAISTNTNSWFQDHGYPSDAGRKSPEDFFNVFENMELGRVDSNAFKEFCLATISRAEEQGIEIDDDNVIGLISNHSNASLSLIAEALKAAGLESRFPSSTKQYNTGRER